MRVKNADVNALAMVNENLLRQRSGKIRKESISQKNMTTGMEKENKDQCPAEGLLKTLSGKWKPQIFRLALEGPVRFNALLRHLEGSNKQSIAVALKELEEQGLLGRTVVREKPLHIEYTLSEKGRMLIPVFRQLELLANDSQS